KVPELALPLLRRMLGICDVIVFGQKVDDLENLAVSKLGNIELRPDEMEALDDQYDWWRNKIANLLGVYVNPYEKDGKPGINVPALGYRRARAAPPHARRSEALPRRALRGIEGQARHR